MGHPKSGVSFAAACRSLLLGESGMASVVQYNGSAVMRDSIAIARKFSADAHELTAFRKTVVPDFDPSFTLPQWSRDGVKTSLSTLIESEIIPRLMVAHSTDIPQTLQTGSTVAIMPGEVEALAPLALEVEADALLEHIEKVLDRGVEFDTLMVDLLAPTARLLGEYWEADVCDFIDVTMGLWRLQEVVHEIACRIPSERQAAAGGRRALFASMPGDQHNFGTIVIDELFRRDGWMTDRMSDAETSDLLHRASSEWFDMIGLTISCDCHIGSLPSIIVGLRSVSRNPQVCVMVGGRIFSADPHLAATVGADGTARDARLALTVAADLVRSNAWESADCR